MIAQGLIRRLGLVINAIELYQTVVLTREIWALTQIILIMGDINERLLLIRRLNNTVITALYTIR